ncbi:MAG: TRAP transporter small permease [Rhodospirillales bacterium]|nr:TRAP transporter small permease [Rhodospirillales bacterium]
MAAREEEQERVARRRDPGGVSVAEMSYGELPVGNAPAAHSLRPPLAEGVVEWACRMLCRLALIATIVIINLELITRNLFNFSLYLSDEYSGYLLVALTFLSLPLCVSHGSFHRVTFLLGRLPPRLRDVVLLAFDVLALTFCAVVFWEALLLVLNSRALHATAPTILMTPLWLPQLAMPIGLFAVLVTLGRSVALRVCRLRQS